MAGNDHLTFEQNKSISNGLAFAVTQLAIEGTPLFIDDDGLT